MKVSCRSFFETTKEGARLGPFLEVIVDGSSHRIDHSRFINLLSDELDEAPQYTEIAIGTPESLGVPASQPVREPSSKKALDFLLETIYPDSQSITGDDELLIESDSDTFLRLPWETRVDLKKTSVFRQIANGVSNRGLEAAAKKHAKFLIVRSYAHRRVSGDSVGELKDQMKNEVHGIVDQLVEGAIPPVRVGKITIIKHGTKDEFLGIDFNSFHYIHIIMHGEENGGLCLEKPDNSEQIDELSRDDFLSSLERKGVNGVLIFFLSFCYSAGGKTSETSLAFELIKRGIAEYVVGYNGGAGNVFAKDFSEQFYLYVISGNGIKKSFAEAYKKCLDREYSPLLYGKFLEKENLHIS